MGQLLMQSLLCALGWFVAGVVTVNVVLFFLGHLVGWPKSYAIGKVLWACIGVVALIYTIITQASLRPLSLGLVIAAALWIVTLSHFQRHG